MSMIVKIQALEVINSRGLPTIETHVWTDCGAHGFASVPSGASKGKREAYECLDGDTQRCLGRGVSKAVTCINTEIHALLNGMDVTQQAMIDEALCAADGTTDKSKWGGNTLLSVSIAVARTAALVKGCEVFEHLQSGLPADHHQPLQLPLPMMNIINGGAHADNAIDIQEFMIVPVGAKTFNQAMMMGCEVYHHLKQILQENHHTTSVGDEGGFAPNLASIDEACEVIAEACQRAGYQLGHQCLLALDVAANELFDEDDYTLAEQRYSVPQWVDLVASWVENHPYIYSIEDACAEDDIEGWQQLTQKIGDQVQLVGDDLFVTNAALLTVGCEQKLANAILIKPNQVGTVSEVMATVAVARQNDYHYVISHRSGETEDTFIADLAVALRATQIKTGAPCRSERLSKYNRLLRIEALSEVGTVYTQWT